MDSAPQSSLALEDEQPPLPPARSPSRLDFCLEDLEVDDSQTYEMDWSTEHDEGRTYTFVDEEILGADIAPHVAPHLLNKDHTSLSSDTPSDDDVDALPLFFAPADETEDVAIEHVEVQSPIPVRPLALQIDMDFQEQSVDACASPPPTRIALPRLDYPHHGFSRSALKQRKTLWSARHAKWMEWKNRTGGGIKAEELTKSDAYTGLAESQLRATVSPPPYLQPPPSGLERDFLNHPFVRRERNVDAPIYPRVGDISALRDSYPVDLDRSFCQLPVWTLHKVLYTFTMHMQTSSASPLSSAYNATNVQASLSASTLSSYSSGDDEESDSSLNGDSPLLEPPKGVSPPHSPTLSPCDSLCECQPNWYARWGLLLGIYDSDPTKYTPPPIPSEAVPPSELKHVPLPPPTRIFRFMVTGDDDATEPDSDSEDEHDYGTPIENSGFSDEEYDRALAYYENQSN